jgi:FSR family fosmidomycin resistance protein-like MFS transporter
MDASAAVGSSRQDMKILGLISTGHFMSHFYFLVLPPLFVFLVQDFGVSYTELGMMMTAIYGTAAVAQIPIGFMVDRYGARLILTAGLILMSLGFGLVGFVGAFWMIIPLVMIAAVGNSVFHPADYAILSSSINEARMGRAFSVHTFSGHLGSAVAPAVMIWLAAQFNWRVALIASGIFGLVVMLAMITQWNSLHDDALPKKKKADAPDSAKSQNGLALLFSKPMILFFLFFATLSMTSSGMQAFSVAALIDLHGMPVATATAALTAYLFCSAAGILVGGEISDRTKRHDIVAAVVFVLTAVITVAIAAFDLNLALLIGLMVVMGLGQGIIRPARDMMVRAAAPKGQTGKIFGFVSAGITAGSAIAPIPFGYLIDQGHPEWVFYLMAIFMVVALFTVVIPKDMTAKNTTTTAAQ